MNTGELITDHDTFMNSILANKNTTEALATWMVSNCDNTLGAKMRWEYGQSLIKVMLKIDICRLLWV